MDVIPKAVFIKEFKEEAVKMVILPPKFWTTP